MQKIISKMYVNAQGPTTISGDDTSEINRSSTFNEDEPKCLEKLKRDLERINIKVKIVSGQNRRAS